MRIRENSLRRIALKTVHLINHFLITHSFRGSGRIRNFINRITLRWVRGQVVVPTIHGFDLLVDPIADRGVERAIYLNGSYELGTLHVFETFLNEGDTFIDVGANIGLMSLLASTRVGGKGLVYSFEPSPETFSILTRNVEINGRENVRPFNLGLGSESGTSRLYRNMEYGRGSASLVKKETQEESEGVEITCSTLDELVATHGVSKVKLIKIDVEGWELEVIKGGLNFFADENAPVVCVEYSDMFSTQGGEKVEIYETLLHSRSDYKVFKLAKGKGAPSKLLEIKSRDDLPSHDNIFFMRPEHIESAPPGVFGRE